MGRTWRESGGNAGRPKIDVQKRQLSVSARIAAGRSDAEYRAGNLP